MEFYHIHTLGTCDNSWKVNKVFVIDDKFNNRLYSRLANFKTTVSAKDYPQEVNLINRYYSKRGYSPIKDSISVDDLLSICLQVGVNTENFEKIIKEAKRIIYYARFNNREQALENYRKKYYPQLPSRLHSLFVADDMGLPYWQNALAGEDFEIFRVDVEEEPFVSNEQLFPEEGLTYKETYKAAERYWNAKIKRGMEQSNEYLVRGRVRVLEKVGERRNIK